MATQDNEDETQELERITELIEAAFETAHARTKKVDDLSNRFRELRRKNHFRLMLEDIFKS